MSKNMTRKALATGSGIALVSALFAATPAAAANEVTLAVDGGTGTTTILGETFDLKATIGSLVPDSSNSDLKFFVTNSAGASLTYTADAGTPETGGNGDAREGTEVDGSGTAATGSSSGTSDTVAGVFVDDTGAGNGDEVFTDNQTLSVSSAATAAHSITVQAFLDANDNGVVDSSEFSSNAVTVNFVEYDDAGLQVAMKNAPQLGDGTYVAEITSNVINVAQVDAGNLGVQVGIFVSGTKTAIDAEYTNAYGTLSDANIAANGVAVSLNSDKDALETAATSVTFSDGSAQTTFVAGNYIASAIYAEDQDGTDWKTVGTEISFGLAAAEADATESKESITAVAGSVSTTGAVLKGYTGDINYVVNVKDSDKVDLAGRTVRLTATTFTGTWSVNGDATVSNGDTFDAVTDASGNATFVFKSANGAATDAVAIGAIVSEGVTIEALGDSVDIAYSAATYTAKETTTGVVTQDANKTVAVDEGSTHTMSFRVVDQFGNTFADADYRMKATVTGRTVTTLTDGLGDGVATFSVVDGANTSGDTTVALSYEKLASGVWSSNTDITALNDRTIKYYDQTNAIAITETDETARHALNETKAGDDRDFGFTPTTFETSGANGKEQITLTGSVTNSTTGAAQQGAYVTVSGDSSLLFNVGDVYAFGSLSFYDTDGTLSVNVYSNKTQDDTVVTVTSADGGSDTVKVSFNGVATNAGTSLVINAPDNVLPGSTLQASGLLTDKYGNSVQTEITATDFNDDSDTSDEGETTTGFKVAVSGPGISLTSLPTATNENGVFTINRLLGVNETSGSITITASYDQNDNGLYTDADDIVVTKTITVGEAPATQKVNAGSFKGYVAVYALGYEGQRLSAKIGNDWVIVDPIVNNESANLARVTDFTGAGYDIAVRIYIDRVLIDTIPLTTK